VYGFLKHLTALEGLQDISLTTNGVYLLPNLSRLQASGISRITVSLDTLQREKYAEITGCDAFDRVWQSIEGAHAAGFHPIKINVVALRGINDDELEDLARLSLTYPFHIRFIEHMPMGPSALKDQPLLLVPEIKKRISGLGKLKPVPKTYADGPAQRYRFEHAAGEIGFIAALSRHFCNECNRLRLTASGQLRPCLLAEHEEDLKNPVRSGASDEQIAQIFLKAIQFKPSDHNLASGIPNQVGCSMRSIGG
jgi:cyclic pyranopterin phosphate synthase